MERTIPVTVRDLIATKTGDDEYICGNSEYFILFDFDAEWDEWPTKTARFKWNGKHHDVIFDGNKCQVPKISDTFFFKVGVFAGNLHTTTDARVPAKKSVLCGSGLPDDPPPDVYAQIMEKLNSMSGGNVTPEQIQAAVDAYMAEHPFDGVTQEDLEKAVEDALQAAKDSGEFDGADGKPGEDGAPGADGYTPQRGTDYWTEEDQAQIVSDVLNALPAWEGGEY